MPPQNAKPQASRKPPEKVAEAPFNDLEADLILRSSDEVHFYVVKILTLASPVFADKFSTLPAPPHQNSMSALAEFTQNYKVEALDNSIAGYLMDSVERDHVGVYAIAVTYGYKGIGTKAAQLCLNLPFSMLQSPYLQFATAAHISELFRYHVTCGEVASALASSDRTWLSSLLSKGFFGTKGASGSTVACLSCHAPLQIS
jgi:hypothetical protein